LLTVIFSPKKNSHPFFSKYNVQSISLARLAAIRIANKAAIATATVYVPAHLSTTFAPLCSCLPNGCRQR
jgi:hypothetical protein